MSVNRRLSDTAYVGHLVQALFSFSHYLEAVSSNGPIQDETSLLFHCCNNMGRALSKLSTSEFCRFSYLSSQESRDISLQKPHLHFIRFEKNDNTTRMARLSCGVQCSSAILFALNLLFFLLGFTVMGLGIYMRVNGNFDAIAGVYNISQVLGWEAMQSVGAMLIAAGVFTSLIAAFGCLGAILQKRVFLYLYAALLTFIILVQFAAVIVTLVYRNNLWYSFDSGLMEVFQRAYGQNQSEAIRMIENVEREFQCCGVDGAFDYIKFGYKLPLSCFPSQSPLFLPFNRGCAQGVVLWLWAELPLIAGGVGAILLVEIFGVIASLVLGVAIAHSTQAARYVKF